MNNAMGTMLFIQSQVGQVGEDVGLLAWFVAAVIACLVTLGVIWLMDRNP